MFGPEKSWINRPIRVCVRKKNVFLEILPDKIRYGIENISTEGIAIKINDDTDFKYQVGDIFLALIVYRNQIFNMKVEVMHIISDNLIGAIFLNENKKYLAFFNDKYRPDIIATKINYYRGQLTVTDNNIESLGQQKLSCYTDRFDFRMDIEITDDHKLKRLDIMYLNHYFTYEKNQIIHHDYKVLNHRMDVPLRQIEANMLIEVDKLPTHFYTDIAKILEAINGFDDLLKDQITIILKSFKFN